jgi:hypothetical protein
MNSLIAQLNKDHAERMSYIEKLGIELRNEEDSIRRIYREKLRYETAIDAFRKYYCSVEEWNDENYKDGDLVK